MPDAPPQPTRATFELTDRSGRLAGVRLVQEIGLDGPLDFTGARGLWRLNVELPAVQRMEYLFEIRDHHGARTTIPDPANPLRAPGAFGEKSVLELDGYRAPAWLAMSAGDGDLRAVSLEAPALDGVIDLAVWAPDGFVDEPAPLMIVHDGPEYAQLAAFARYLSASIGAGALPPLRAALLGPGDRNAWYSANPDYVQTLVDVVLPALDEIAPATMRIGVGASLGGLAMLHLHRRSPHWLDALFLQSGSFFTAELDPQESKFSGFAAVTSFVADVHAAAADSHPVPTVLTCGTVEENLANNESMTLTLRRLGYPATLVSVPDAHNYTAWRDALDPHLTTLITDLVCARAA